MTGLGWLDRRLAMVLPVAAVHVALGWGIASPEQRVDYSNGDLSGIWMLVAAILVVAAVHGLFYGAIEESDSSETNKRKSSSHGMTYFRDLLCHIARSLNDITAKVSALPIVAVMRVTPRRDTSHRLLLPLPLLDCWPAGRSPQIVYEQLA